MLQFLIYDDLPYYLKPCFLYLSLFPEDFEIPVGMLTRMWIAEGLVSAPGDMPVEDAAMQHLEELSHRFLIQVVRINYKGVIKAVSLHDLLRDVGLRKAKELSFLQIYAPVSEPGFRDKCVSDIQPRRAALHSSNSFPAEISYLRSLVLLKSSNTPESVHNYTETLDLKIVPRSYKLLRLLTLQGIRAVSGSLPIEIGSLLHLRYLEIRGTNITKLPGSIGKLSCLLVLDYRDVVLEDYREPIIEIPNVLWKLVLLRHLFLPIDYQWNVEELILSTLPNLQTLWGVKQDKAGHQWLSREIPKLSSTVKKLKIVVSSEDELKAAFSNPSIMSNGLQTFHCELQGGITFGNVVPLCHQRRLHKLILIGQVRMPLSLILPKNLIKLRLKNSVLKNEDPMIALGALSHLKLLILSNVFEGTELVCRPGSFPQLEELYLENFMYLQVWNIDKGAMPCLKKLEIRRCRCFKQFPRSLEFVTALQQFDFYAIPDSFIKEAAQYGWSPCCQKKKINKYGWSPPKLGLPYNFHDIVRRADSTVDTSSLLELYALLSTGIFLDNKKQKYWVVEQHNIYNNCFKVYAPNLYLSKKGIGCAYDTPMLDPVISTKDKTSVEVLELDSSEVIAHGKFDTADLSPDVTYEIMWVVMYTRSDYDHFHPSIPIFDYIHTELSYRGCETELPLIQQHSYDGTKPYNWFQVFGGEFKTEPTIMEEVLVSIRPPTRYHLGLGVQGFIIQPKP